MHDDFLHSSGNVFIAHRLRRLSDRFVAQIGEVMDCLNLKVPPTAGSTMTLLAQGKRLGITEIAAKLGVSHPFIVRLVAKLEELTLVRVEPDKDDLRRKWVLLTQSGAKEAAKLERLNIALERVFNKLAEETDTDLLSAINLYESALCANTLTNRLVQQLNLEDS